MRRMGSLLSRAVRRDTACEAASSTSECSWTRCAAARRLDVRMLMTAGFVLVLIAWHQLMSTSDQQVSIACQAVKSVGYADKTRYTVKVHEGVSQEVERMTCLCVRWTVIRTVVYVDSCGLPKLPVPGKISEKISILEKNLGECSGKCWECVPRLLSVINRCQVTTLVYLKKHDTIQTLH